MSFDSDILIAGGGLNGSTLALALAATGQSVTIVEPRPLDALHDTQFDGRSYAMALTSTRLLQALGLWGAIEADAQPMLEIKVSDGRAGATDVDGVASELPDRVALHPAYPNPFNPATTLSFDLPRASAVTLEVYDAMGRLVRTFVDSVMDAGRHEIRFEVARQMLGHSSVSRTISVYSGMETISATQAFAKVVDMLREGG